MAAVGRLDRKHYWIAIVLLIAVKVCVLEVVGGSEAGKLTVGLDAMLLLAMIARLHDLGCPTWQAAILWLAIAVGLPLGCGLLLQSSGVIPLLGLVALGMYAIAGLFPGDPGANANGPPGRGFEGLLRPLTIGGQSSTATARVQPADPPLILTGKQMTVKPLAGSLSRLASFSIWQ